MNWELSLDDALKPVPPPGSLGQFITAAQATTVQLGLIRPRKVPWFERTLYRALGLRSPNSTPLATMSAQFAGSLALVSYSLDDGDGVVAALPAGSAFSEPVEFRLPHADPVLESGTDCIPRALALSLLEDFFASGRQPSGVSWRPRVARGA